MFSRAPPSFLGRFNIGEVRHSAAVTPLLPDRCGHVAPMVIEREQGGFLGIFFWRFPCLYVLVLFCHLGQHSVHLYPDEHH